MQNYSKDNIHLITVNGFLGSGKTTVLNSLARGYTNSGLKVAIIVNEIGDIGVDASLLKQHLKHVWELVSGCICCTLMGDFTTTLKEVIESFSPDIIILEPSGMNDPRNILKIIEDLKGVAITKKTFSTIIDPTRLAELTAVLSPLMESHVMVADIIFITKADIVDQSDHQFTKAWIEGLKPDAPCYDINAREKGMGARLQEILSCLN